MKTLIVKTLMIMAGILIGVNSGWSDISPRRETKGHTLTSGDKAVEQIEMQAEEVYMVLSKTTLQVKAVFHMNNTGPELKIKEGFPMGYYSDILKEFSATCNNKKIDTEITDILEGAKGPRGKTLHDYWVIWDNTYPADSKQDMEVSYVIKGDNWHKEYQHTTGYILQTGADWKGAIGKAVITLTFEEGLSPLNIFKISRPDAAVIQKDKIVWTFEQLNPTEKDNINITFFTSKDYATVLSEYENGYKGWNNTIEVREYARLHDRKVYWETAKRLLVLCGKPNETGEIILPANIADIMRGFAASEIPLIFQEALNNTKKEAIVMEVLALSTEFVEYLLNEKIFIDKRHITYPRGRKGKKEVIQIKTHYKKAELSEDIEKAHKLIADGQNNR